MSFSTQHVKNYYLYDTEIENLFISEYMPSAPGNYVKLFLYALMSAKSDLGFDNETAARKLGMSLAEVVEGWTYWESQGLVRKTCPDPQDRDRFDIEFLNIKEAAFGRRSSEEDLPQTSVKLDDRELSTLFGDVEKATGRILESGEPEEISSWIRDFGADPEVIVLAYTYCSRNRRSNRYRYVGTVIKDWLAKRLTSAQDVEEYLATVDRHYDLYKKVCRELGFHRNPTEPEKRIMDSWFGEMGFTIEKVLEACQKTAGIANPNIKYVDSVLRDWKSEEKNEGEGSLIREVEKSYEREREENRKKTEKRRAEVFAALPEVKEISEELKGCSIKLSKAALSGKSDLESERRKVADLRNRRKELLVAAGFPEDATDNIYTCRICRDTGEKEDGTRCECFDRKLAALRSANGKI